MAETKWTPGEWKEENSGEGLWITGPNRGESVICDMVPRQHRIWHAEDAANAHLIASAPDLYTALDGMVSACEDLYKSGRLDASAWLAARAALAKARGE